MKIAVFTHHIGSSGLRPSGQYGGGELLTFGWLKALSEYYEVMAVVQNGVYPGFDNAIEYGIDLSKIDWRPIGDSADWIRKYDVLINISHSSFMPPIAKRNIMLVMFPQYPQWDISGYDTVIGISDFTSKWIKNYWGREATTIYPPLPVQDIISKAQLDDKMNNIMAIGRFFNVPHGNNKSHTNLISAFQGMYRPDASLTFVGSVQDRNYYNEVRQAAGNDKRIRFYHDLNREAYLALLSKSRFLWHAAGFETLKPASKEHFGIIAVEALAAGVQPFVFNDGGIVEIDGVKPWNTTAELSELTVQALEGQMSLKPETMQKRAMRFDIDRIKTDILKVVEDENVVLYPKPEQGKVYSGDPKPSDIKVGIFGDDPNITTGFGAVSRAITKGLIAKGFRVANLGIQNPMTGKTRLVPEDMKRIFNEAVFDKNNHTASQMQQAFYDKLANTELSTTWRGCAHDPSGFGLIGQFMDVEQPDVVFINYDPGNIRNILDKLRDTKKSAPIVAYVPIEGSPVIPQYIDLLRTIKVMNGEPILYTRYGQKAVKEANGPDLKFAYHGADHADFRKFDAEHRKQLRLAVGWQNKKVMMFVGRNKRTKGIDTLLQTARLLKDKGRDDIVWYIHTHVWDAMPNSSMPLDQLVHIYGVADRVFFPDINHQVYGIPYDEPASYGQIDENDSLDKIYRTNLNSLSMIERYNIADAFINASELEGHGLPYIEAMGCGLPIISIDDKAVQQEILGEAAMYVPAHHFDVFHTGARLAQGSPKDFAGAILELVSNQALYNEMQAKSLKRYQDFKWQNTVDTIAQAIMERYTT